MMLIPYLLLMFALVPAWRANLRVTLALIVVAALIALPFAEINFLGWFFIAVLGLALWLPQKLNLNGWKLAVCHAIFLMLGAAMVMHVVPGFNNYAFFKGVQVSENSTPFSLYLNFDKTSVGLFVLLFYLRPKTLDGLRAANLKTAGIALGALILVMIPLVGILGYAKLDVKFPAVTWIWMLNQIVFVVVSEEAFHRGFIQHGLAKFKRLPFWAPVLVGAISFGFNHWRGGPVYMGLAFVAGLFYGWTYLKTRRLESAMLVHFAFNCVHFFFFTYPTLH